MAKPKPGGTRKQFDKTVRESFDGIIRKSRALPFGFNYRVIENIDSLNMVKTQERRLDFVKVVDDPSGRRIVLHIEFQTKDAKDMVIRMQDYRAAIQNKYQLPVKQIVVYLGARPSKMKHRIRDLIPGDYIDYHFELFEIRNFDAAQLLASDIPEEVVLATLAAPGKPPPHQIIVKILNRLKTLCNDDYKLEKNCSRTASCVI